MKIPENAIELDVAERDVLTPGMTAGDFADAILRRLGLPVGPYTVVAKSDRPGLLLIERKVRADQPDWMARPAVELIALSRSIWS